MNFAEIETEKADGAVLAHSIKLQSKMLKKGQRLTAADVSMLLAGGVRHIFVAQLGPGDVAEDEAAATVAKLIAGTGTSIQDASTGRANIHSMSAGLAIVDDERLRRLNRLHESLTIASLPPYAKVEEGQMVATVKIIPFAVPKPVLTQVMEVAGNRPLVEARSFSAHRAALVITRLPQTKDSVIDKSRDGVRSRLEILGSSLARVVVVEHSVSAVSDAISKLKGEGHDPVLVFGASAIVDRGDVVPAGLVAAGGEIVHLGMPVDPGNLLLYGRLSGATVIGVPTCARSPKLNGFDWVLQRTLAGLDLSPNDIMDMGVGGLLMEIPSRPRPREAAAPKPEKSGVQIAAVVLAAGRSTRMGSNKLLKSVEGKLMIRRTVENVLQSKASPVLVVTGHEDAKIREALVGLPVTFAHNPNYAEGLSTSLKAGISQLPPDADGALVILGDMPLVPVVTMNRLISAFNPEKNRSICVPVFEGERGNPILWGRQHFAEFEGIRGDGGAKVLLVVNTDNVLEVPVRTEGVLTDFDTPDSLNAVR